MSPTNSVFILTVLLSFPIAAHSLRAAEPPITAAAFSPDGKSIVVGSQQGIEVRSWPSLKPERAIETKLAHVHHLAFSPDGKTLAAAGGTPQEAGDIELHPWENEAAPNTHSVHDDLTYQVAWSPDGSRLATAGADSFVHLLDRDGKRIGKFAGHSRGVLSVAWLPAGEQLLTAGIDQSVRLWDVKSGELIRTLDNHTAEVRDLAVRPGEHPLPIVASASADRTVRLWQPTIGRLVRFARLPEEPLDIAWTPDGSQLLAACTDGHLRVIDPDTVEVVRDVAAIDGWAYTVVAAPDGRSALVAGSRGQMKAVSLTSSK